MSEDAPRNGVDLPLDEEYRRVRARSHQICAPLAVDDCNVQPMDDASPPKWHLAHTTWFFETFLLKRFEPGFKPWHPRFEYLFNSYYNAVGNQFPRPRRGHLSRPTLDEVLTWRDNVDGRMRALIEGGNVDRALLILGLNHEEQHQELMLTDLKYNLGNNPLYPAYRDDLTPRTAAPTPTLGWLPVDAGLAEIGTDWTEGDARSRFMFDNETPRFSISHGAFEIADRPVTNGEYLEFIEAGGYSDPLIWLSDGWTCVRERAWAAPLYWLFEDGQWLQYTHGGLRPLDLAAPVCHVSFYEAEAYARWAGARLPTEIEWERAAGPDTAAGNFYESGALEPRSGGGFFGDVWEWTGSPYQAYPGFRPAAGDIGEYNGKFMCNQMVLRGGSCLTPARHIRPTYRNFFYPPDRWQMTGFRLARDPA